MCGILGAISFSNDLNYDYNVFQDALNLQYHRGPDDFGIKSEEKFIFGHRRLSILDLSSHAKQPMISADNNIILTFNGEIYNYKEIRKDLEKKDYLFKTDSDTEVLLYSYCEYGIECINLFIGMFAFSIYDKKKDISYIVRDRLGVKPLYYFHDDKKIIFSSEIKSILKLEPKKRSINMDAVSSYLSFRYPILGDTFFDDIFSLEPAHYIEIKKNKYTIKEYWSVWDKFKEQKKDKGEEYYIEELQRLLSSSVKYRMIADVPVGSFLSGGVDSSAIVSLMYDETKKAISTFNIGFAEDGYNEFEYAKMVAKKYKTDHHEIILDGKNYIKNMEKLIGYKDAPLGIPNEVPLYLMSKKLKKYITVVLSGEGADEIFGGYGRIFRSPFDYERMKSIKKLKLNNKEQATFKKNFFNKYAQDSFNDEIDHFFNIYSYTNFNDKKELLDNSIDLKGIEFKLQQKFRYHFNEIKNESYYNKMMYAFEKIHIVGLLQRLDSTTMATSVEGRVPFVDHRLVEFAFTIPLKYKLKWKSEQDKVDSKLIMSDKISEENDIPKYILKKAFEEKLPNDVLYRKKMGFPVPLNNWFGGEFIEYSRKILLNSKTKNRNIFNIENIEKWLNSKKLSQDHRFSMKIWMLINLELFFQKYFDD